MSTCTDHPFFLLYFMRPDHKKTPIGLIQAGTRARCLAKTGSREDCHWTDSSWYASQVFSKNRITRRLPLDGFKMVHEPIPMCTPLFPPFEHFCKLLPVLSMFVLNEQFAVSVSLFDSHSVVNAVTVHFNSTDLLESLQPYVLSTLR